MLTLTPDECRVLGVLVEKAHTTATQYPLSLNAVVAGCNQKSNRHPVTNFDDQRAHDALESLREKGLVLVVDTIGSRVMKYKHEARQGLEVGTRELVILTELMLRGPQTAGEIRSRASRMSSLGSLDEVRNTLQHMMQLEEPLAQRVAPAPGSRAERFGQLLCPDLHPTDAPAVPVDVAASIPTAPEVNDALSQRVDELEGRLAALTGVVARLAGALGEPAGELGEGQE